MTTQQMQNRINELDDLIATLQAVPNEQKSIADLAREGRLISERSKLIVATF